MKALVITGKQGSGKTTHKKTFLAAYKKHYLIDEWDGMSDLHPDTLALTTVERHNIDNRYHVIDIEEARKACNILEKSAFPIPIKKRPTKLN